MHGEIKIGVLPQPYDGPPCRFKSRCGFEVALSVALDLRGPVPTVHRVLAPTVRRAPVPEASVHEYGNASAREDDVRSTTEFREWADVHPVAMTTCMESSS